MPGRRHRLAPGERRRRTTCSCTRGRPRRSCRTPCSSGRRTGWRRGCRRPSSSCRGRPCWVGRRDLHRRARTSRRRRSIGSRRWSERYVLGSSGIEETIQTACLASKATLASLTRSYGLVATARAERHARQEARRIPGRPAVAGADPADVGRAAVEEAPDLEVETTVDPKANVSGSTSVACWLVAFVNGSELTRVTGTLALACAARARRAAVARSASQASVRSGAGRVMARMFLRRASHVQAARGNMALQRRILFIGCGFGVASRR